MNGVVSNAAFVPHSRCRLESLGHQSSPAFASDAVPPSPLRPVPNPHPSLPNDDLRVPPVASTARVLLPVANPRASLLVPAGSLLWVRDAPTLTSTPPCSECAGEDGERERGYDGRGRERRVKCSLLIPVWIRAGTPYAPPSPSPSPLGPPPHGSASRGSFES